MVEGCQERAGVVPKVIGGCVPTTPTMPMHCVMRGGLVGRWVHLSRNGP